MKIKKGGIYRHVSERAFHRKWESLGYEVVEEKQEDNFDVKEITVEIDGEKIAAQLKREWLEEKTVNELQTIAKELELSGYYKLNKDELIAEIEKVE